MSSPVVNQLTGGKKEFLTCSVCQFPWCRDIDGGGFQATEVTSLNAEWERDVRYALSGARKLRLCHGLWHEDNSTNMLCLVSLPDFSLCHPLGPEYLFIRSASIYSVPSVSRAPETFSLKAELSPLVDAREIPFILMQ